jgi:hypothetical protein
VRVTSEKQTLILAGEPLPPRADNGAPLQRVTMLLVQGEYAAGAIPPTITVESLPAEGAADTLIGLPAGPADFRGSTAGAAQYARTQSFAGGRQRRRPLIDTYA